MPVAEPINIQPKRILVITLRFLGDTLLTTPLIRSLKQAYPDAAIDVLTFKANAAMLEGNPDISALIPLNGKPSASAFAKLLISLFRRYDLAVSTQAGDRPVLCAILAGKLSLGFVDAAAGKAWWKKWLLNRWLVFREDYDHAVLENLRFCDLLGIQRHYLLTPPKTSAPLPEYPVKPYAVLHIMPQWRYKEWHSEGWTRIIEFLHQRGIGIVLTGSQQPNEMQALAEFRQTLAIDVVSLAGRLTLAQLTELIVNAELFVGPDTGITHLAAATGTLTFAIYGPTDPKKWAPWPLGYAEDVAPFLSVGSQRVGNVHLIQGQHESGCVPCQLEGCERHRDSDSACLDGLPANQVIDTILSSLSS
ncbi:MAG: glycosyltransferase family 9 protein [Methylomonas sp.]|nr:glycosyltransferase family 9 protein [Methylomonas sp.]